MSRRTTSLRQRHPRAALAACASLAALLQTGVAFAAGGSPLPAPDAPPPGHALRPARATAEATQTNVPQATPTAKSTPKTTTRAVTPTPDTPSPDPPLATATPQTASKPKPARRNVIRTTAPRAAVTTAPDSSTTYTPPSAPTRTERIAAPPAAKPKPKPKPAKRPVVAARTPSPPPVTRPPHDTLRIGLPVAVLAPLEDDASTQFALLLAAAVLLAASGAGGLVVGLSARRLARGA
jgi:hypothetical protein